MISCSRGYRVYKWDSTHHHQSHRHSHLLLPFAAATKNSSASSLALHRPGATLEIVRRTAHPHCSESTMWRRLVSSRLKTLAVASFAPRSATAGFIRDRSSSRLPSSVLSSRCFAGGSGETAVKKKVEDVMPIATGHEREELEAELQGRNILEIDYPVGPFGTKGAPAVVKSVFDKRIVGCPGGEGEDEHDVVWFWLKKGQPHECPVCSQYFVLEVVGHGGSPYHGEDDGHH